MAKYHPFVQVLQKYSLSILYYINNTKSHGKSCNNINVDCTMNDTVK